jgi:hypothetical protein
MAVTAGEILLKTNRIIPSGDTVLAGSGPLLLLVATHLISAGVTIQAFLDTTPLNNYFGSLKYLPNVLPAVKDLFKGFQMQQKIRKSGVPIYWNVKNLRAIGADSLESVRFQYAGKTKEIKASTLFLHNGLVPNTQMTMLIDCDHYWDPVQRYWRPVLDNWGNTSVSGVSVAGDAARIAGASAAETSGYLAGLQAAFSLKMISEQERDRKARPLQEKLARATRIRPFLNHLYQPSPELLVPRDDETIVCRCEELTVGQIKNALTSSLSDLNQVKALTRCGMGLCQGRMCALTLAEVIADYRKDYFNDLDFFRIRPPVKPISFEQLSNLQLAIPSEEANEIG